tara:strand:+ start:57 stop:287 length:231 start_codon:yes stop_codon:yes gene_type:complete
MMSQSQKWIADTVTSKRKAMGLTREQLSWDAGVAAATIRNLEMNSHNITYNKLALIVEALGMELELMDIDAPQEID